MRVVGEYISVKPSCVLSPLKWAVCTFGQIITIVCWFCREENEEMHNHLQNLSNSWPSFNWSHFTCGCLAFALFVFLYTYSLNFSRHTVDLNIFTSLHIIAIFEFAQLKFSPLILENLTFPLILPFPTCTYIKAKITQIFACMYVFLRLHEFLLYHT